MRGVKGRQDAQMVRERGGHPRQQTCTGVNETNKAHLEQVRGGLPQEACTIVDERLEARPAQQRDGLPRWQAGTNLEELYGAQRAQVGGGAPSGKPVPTTASSPRPIRHG